MLFRSKTDITLPSRNSVKEVYDQIYADLNAAITLLSDVDVPVNTATNRSYIDVFAARAALAKVALYAKDYTTAIDQSTACINNTALALATRTLSVDPQIGFSPVIWDAWELNWIGKEISTKTSQKSILNRLSWQSAFNSDIISKYE